MLLYSYLRRRESIKTRTDANKIIESPVNASAKKSSPYLRSPGQNEVKDIIFCEQNFCKIYFDEFDQK